MEDIQLIGVVNNWLVMNVKTIGVNVKRGGKGNETTAWVSLEMPTDRALPIARPLEDAGEQPENTLTYDEITLTVQALLEKIESALTGDTAGW